ncbi:probable peroxisomal membrane protein PEX13 [Galendromus occidentalis]|uniref:Peroxisomal membrane protein PEX13 n=1 Tax=Galendromus occidentalis TaxID=34638 RepID=A0AAJ6VVY5_9ACAR|nr:probable peroxisomal membrane protein PEX13 [Galendromus occidentalis]
MALPPKPWESTTSPELPAAAIPAQNSSDGPPPVPRYNDDMNAFGSYGGGLNSYHGSPFMSRYGGMGYPGSYGQMYGGYGGYGGYGSYGGMMGNYGAPNGESELARMADESTRSAFQSVEHLVHAFSSVSMMLESTYFALYNSFRAVIGVADHLSSVTQQLSQLINSLSLIRTLRWIIRRSLQVLGIVQVDSAETAWNSASHITNQDALVTNTSTSSWPVLAFFSVVMGAPYLLYKMFGLSAKESNKWASGEAPHYSAVALYDFIGRSDRELSFQAGAKIRLAPKNLQSKVQGWLVASIDGKRTGLVPYNYLKILGPSESIGAPTTAPQSVSTCQPRSSADPEVFPAAREEGDSPTNTPNGFVNISMSEVSK